MNTFNDRGSYFLAHSGHFAKKLDGKFGIEYQSHFPTRIQRQEYKQACTTINALETQRRGGEKGPDPKKYNGIITLTNNDTALIGKKFIVQKPPVTKRICPDPALLSK
jgi:hypothetical protein